MHPWEAEAPNLVTPLHLYPSHIKPGSHDFRWFPRQFWNDHVDFFLKAIF